MPPKAKTSHKPALAEAAEERRRSIDHQTMIDPGMWFELHGAIEPKVGPLIRRPKLTSLQERKAEVLAYCLKNKLPCRIISLKARQDGSSTFSVAIGYRLLESMRAIGCIIGGAYTQAQNLFRKLKVFAENDSFSQRVRCDVLQREARFDNGSLMEQLTASNPEAGRSGTYQVVIATEVARWSEEGVANAADVLVGLLKCVANEPLTYIELESTARGASGDFYDRWNNGITFEELKEGKRGFVKLFAPWFEAPHRRLDPALEMDREQCVSPTKVAELKRQFGLDDEQIAWMQWAVREECKKDFDTFCEDYPFDPESAFVTSGRCRFNLEKIAEMKKEAHVNQPKFGMIDLIDERAVWRETVAGEARIIRWEPPRGGLRYLISVDSMTGETQVGGKDPDNHAVGVMRAGYFESGKGWVPPKLVARLVDDWSLWERNHKYELRWDIDVLEQMIWALAVYYGGCQIVPEMNADRGLVELLKLRPGANIYIRKVWNKREQKPQNALGFYTDPKTREAIVEKLAGAIREKNTQGDGIVIYCPITLSELETFVVKKSGRSEAAPGKHDDCVLQTAIGLTTIEGATPYREVESRKQLPPDLAALERERLQSETEDMAMRW